MPIKRVTSDDLSAMFKRPPADYDEFLTQFDQEAIYDAARAVFTAGVWDGSSDLAGIAGANVRNIFGVAEEGYLVYTAYADTGSLAQIMVTDPDGQPLATYPQAVTVMEWALDNLGNSALAGQIIGAVPPRLQSEVLGLIEAGQRRREEDFSALLGFLFANAMIDASVLQTGVDEGHITADQRDAIVAGDTGWLVGEPAPTPAE